MNSKTLLIIGGVVVAFYLIFRTGTASAAGTGASAATGGGEGGLANSGASGSNPSGAATNVTGNAPTSANPTLDARARSAEAEIRAEVDRIYNSGATAKNKYDWIYAQQVSASNFRNTWGVKLPVEDYAASLVAALHSAAYPGAISKTLSGANSSLFGWTANRILN